MSITITKKKRGRPFAPDTEKLKSDHTTVCLTSHIKSKLLQIAERRGMPVATLMREVLEKYVKKANISKDKGDEQ